MRVRQACLPNVRSAVVLVTDTCSTCGPTQISLAAPVYYQHMSRNPTAAVHYRAVRSLHHSSHAKLCLRCHSTYKLVLGDADQDFCVSAEEAILLDTMMSNKALTYKGTSANLRRTSDHLLGCHQS